MRPSAARRSAGAAASRCQSIARFSDERDDAGTGLGGAMGCRVVDRRLDRDVDQLVGRVGARGKRGGGQGEQDQHGQQQAHLLGIGAPGIWLEV